MLLTQWVGKVVSIFIFFIFVSAKCFNWINWHYWSIQMKTNRVWGRSWLPRLQKVPAAHCFQVPQLNRQSFHGPLESHTSTAGQSSPIKFTRSLHSFRAGNDFFVQIRPQLSWNVHQTWPSEINKQWYTVSWLY